MCISKRGPCYHLEMMKVCCRGITDAYTGIQITKDGGSYNLTADNNTLPDKGLIHSMWDLSDQLDPEPNDVNFHLISCTISVLPIWIPMLSQIAKFMISGFKRHISHIIQGSLLLTWSNFNPSIPWLTDTAWMFPMNSVWLARSISYLKKDINDLPSLSHNSVNVGIIFENKTM